MKSCKYCVGLYFQLKDAWLQVFNKIVPYTVIVVLPVIIDDTSIVSSVKPGCLPPVVI